VKIVVPSACQVTEDSSTQPVKETKVIAHSVCQGTEDNSIFGLSKN